MGTEYKGKFSSENAAQIDAVLRALPCFFGFVEQGKSYVYREENNTGEMPDAQIRPEDEGIYCCDYGMSRHLFGFLITSLFSHFDSVQIEDWEP